MRGAAAPVAVWVAASAVQVCEAGHIAHGKVALGHEVPTQESSRRRAAAREPSVRRARQASLRMPVGPPAGVDFRQIAELGGSFAGDRKTIVGVRAGQREPLSLECSWLQKETAAALPAFETCGDRTQLVNAQVEI